MDLMLPHLLLEIPRAGGTAAAGIPLLEHMPGLANAVRLHTLCRTRCIVGIGLFCPA